MFTSHQPGTAPARRSTVGRRVAAVAAAIALGATACTSSSRDDSATPTTDLSGNDIQLTSALITVDDCDALLGRIKAEALERVGPYGFGNGFYGPMVAMAEEEGMADDAMEESASAELTSAPSGDVDASSGGRAGEDFSETNNQEQGVDEADLVKTDGSRLVIITGNQMRVIDVTGDTPTLTQTIKLPDEFWGGELFLNGDTALLMTSGWTERPFFDDRLADTAWYPGSPTGRIMEVDLVNGTVERTLEFEGGYLSAREIDGSIRIVMSATENRFNFVFPSNPGAEEAAENANRDLIENSTIDMWIPTYRITENGDTVDDGPVVDCDRVHLPTEFAGFGSLVVMTANIDEGLRIDDSLSVFTDGQTVYASPDRLAVAAPRWPEFDQNGEPDTEGYRTALHSFDISDPITTRYAASGTVRGYLLNRFSMSEYEGFLRVATTDGTPWDSRGSESFVTVLEESGGELVEVGQVGGLGFGEQIFAVRFLGDKGYVVTFEQIDPLYTIDLRDPRNPTVRGELKITGVSDYLHPYGNDLVIGIGRSGDENGLTGSVAVSVFDVSNPDNPTRIDELSLGINRPQDGRNGWAESYSPVSYDARAFTMWGDTMIVPIGWWSSLQTDNGYQEDNGNAAILIKVDEDSGTLTKIGEIGHPETRECEGRPIPLEDGPGGVVVRRGAEAGLATGAAEAAQSSEALTPTTVNEGSGDAEADFARDDSADDEAPPPAIEVDAVDEEDAPFIDGPDFCWTFQPEIRRSVIIGDSLYTLSDAGVAVNNFVSLDTVTWIQFDR